MKPTLFRLSLALPFSLVLAVTAPACSGGGGGDDDDDDGFSDDGGEGTGTLRITASVVHAADGTLLATVQLANEMSQVVNGATVVLSMPEQGEVTLVAEPPGFGTYVLPAGDWQYEGSFGLEIDAGAEGNATGIGFNAPEPTEITSPENFGSLPLNTDAAVTWAGRGAEHHRVELFLNDYDSGFVAGDPGSFTIPAAVLQTAGTETITVRRRKEIDLTAGTPNSVFAANLDDVLDAIGIVP